MTGSVATPLLVLWRLQALQLLLLLYLLRSSSRSRNCVQPAFVLSYSAASSRLSLRATAAAAAANEKGQGKDGEEDEDEDEDREGLEGEVV